MPDATTLKRWPAAVIRHLGLQFEADREMAVRVVGIDEGRELNRRYRGRDTATNVLSFPAAEQLPLPAGEAVPLGDLVVCAPIVSREATEQDKEASSHWAHMLVHGTLHLLGYDHEQEAEALAMEALEVAILAANGVKNPYLERDSAG